MNGIIVLGLWQMVAAYAFLAVALLLVRKQRVGIEGEVVAGSVRMTVQLVLVGYLLTYVFGRPNPIVTLLIFAVMETFAIGNVFARLKGKLYAPLKPVITSAMVIGTTLSLFYFLLVVVGVKPWYHPQYFIPLAGMILGNSMTAAALGADRLISGLRANAAQIECALMLGARPEAAAKPFAREAFRAAIMPTVNSMMGMGIVSLPGMMTGQILSGTLPLTAIAYQIAIMLGITGSVAATVYILTEFGQRVFFNADSQLEIGEF